MARYTVEDDRGNYTKDVTSFSEAVACVLLWGESVEFPVRLIDRDDCNIIYRWYDAEQVAEDAES